MSRPLRLEFHGALYHITARGDGREDIFRGDGDRVLFLDVLAIGEHFGVHYSRVSRIVAVNQEGENK